MKKFNLFAIGVVAMLMAAVNVSALNDGDLTTCLSGSSCTLTVEDGTRLNLSSAVTISKDTTINLEGNASIVLGTSAVVTVQDGKTLTINGENNNINATAIDNSASNVFIVNGGGNLALNGVNLKANNTAHSPNNNYAIIKAVGTKASKIDIGETTTITGYNTAVAVFGNYVTVNMAGTINVSDNGIAVSGTLNTDGHRSVLNLTGSVNSKNNAAIYAAGLANWNITAGTYTGKDAVSIKSGSVTITDGTFEATGAFSATPTASSTGEELTGAAVSITTNSSYAGDVELSISGGTFKSAKGYALYEGGAVSTKLNSINVTGGDFTGAQPNVVSVAHDTEFIEDGTFTSTAKTPTALPSNYLVSGKKSYVDDEGNIVLAKLYKGKVVSVKNETELKFATVEFEAAEGEEVNLATIMCTELGGTACSNKYKFEYSYDLATRSTNTGVDKLVMPASDINISVTVATRANSKVMVTSVKNNGITVKDIVGTIKALEGSEIDFVTRLGLNASKYVVVYTATYGDQTVTGTNKLVVPGAELVTVTLEVYKKGEEPKPSETTPAPGDEPGTQEPGTTTPSGSEEQQPGATNPDTLDNVTSVAAMGGISLAIAAAGIATLKKREN